LNIYGQQDHQKDIIQEGKGSDVLHLLKQMRAKAMDYDDYISHTEVKSDPKPPSNEPKLPLIR
jgi:hypothetical protein